ncbi:hypothetical protein [Polyangium jinanense]|uniref:Uncharacterized protein n=1 Tax=Polyangium jinanense TaxID=2829994 RepID=A0A9X3X8W6_9BACT|nr:hypothetical protein [Polyangium jinanense]MDC3962370.1 hypothetical protein [Polyangium jinanense]MDC3985877.1 hypothetical protein [Polyangium jinanense]
MKSSWSLGGFVVLSVSVGIAGCGSEVNGGGGGGSGGSGAGSTASSGGSGGTGGTGGGMGGAGGSGGAGGGMMAGSGGAGGGMGGAGGGNYASCEECTADTGAPANECQAEFDACMAWKTCVSIYHCQHTATPNGPGPCDTTQAGACCTWFCQEMGLDMEGITRFRALDNCIHCKTCAGVCETTDTYCPVFDPGGSSACIP